MELVEGPSLDRILRTRQLDMPAVFEVLDGVGSGLEAMHRAGLGHLDVKPSNVILRDGAEAVLVDFGLAGRHLRPGCATLPYGAPEVWGVVPEGHQPLAPPADVYAFGALVFELLWGTELFDGPSEMAIVTSHVSHDGWPLKLSAMRDRADVKPIAELIARCLRHDPRERATIEQVRAGLRELARMYGQAAWPIGAA
jgi:serine/threonine protein kinase